jgi:RimJ/RimL family protein N-acetyltransferase
MLKYLFEEQDFLRVQLHTDARNLRSQEAIRRLGAVYEGVLRRHMVAKDGFVRDTVVFAITDLDWPSVKPQLEARLEAKLAALHLHASAG